MSAKSVNIKDFKAELNGKESTDSLLYEFPVVKSVNKHGKTQIWQIVVGILDEVTNTPIKINAEFYNGRTNLPNKIGYYKVLSKLETADKFDIKTPTYIKAGKNLGKANQTNVFTQALRDALSDYNKYVKKSANDGVTVRKQNDIVNVVTSTATSTAISPSGSTDSLNVKLDKSTNIDAPVDVPNDISSKETSSKELSSKELYPPMLATPHDNIKIDFTQPTYIQRKFNGIRAVSTWVDRVDRVDKVDKIDKADKMDKANKVEISGKTEVITDNPADNILMYSRSLGIFPNKNILPIKQELFEILRGHPEVYLDGEIYTHGEFLQDLSGMARGERLLPHEVLELNKTKKTKSKSISVAAAAASADASSPTELHYYIYDLFIPSSPDMVFSERYDKLKSLLKPFMNLKYVVLVDTYQVNSDAEVEEYYNKFIAAKYEGAIVRINSPYVYSYKNRHTANLLKFKQLFDEEYEVKSISAATNGKAAGAILFHFATPKGKVFTVTPKGTIENRKKLFTELNKIGENGKTLFENKFMNHKMRVHYEELSKDNVPTRARIEEIYLRPLGE